MVSGTNAGDRVDDWIDGLGQRQGIARLFRVSEIGALGRVPQHCDADARHDMTFWRENHFPARSMIASDLLRGFERGESLRQQSHV